ncbi:MAG: class I SAM-dependent methyltransferase [Candidatus Aegiribacteria sp.]
MNRHPEAERGNRTHWDELAAAHARSYEYGRLLEGGHLIDDEQLREVGDVEGKSLLHLQCHIGTDTLSWARLGARVTGVDISPESLRVARDLAGKTGLHARFVESNIYDLPELLDEVFDIVYTSVGVLCWLSDLKEWAAVIRRYLRPGGIFYIMDSHPFLGVFDDGSDGLEVRYPYFHEDEPRCWPGNFPDYADDGYMVETPSWEWQWTLGDILNALIGKGFLIDFLHEHRKIPWKALPCMVECGGGFWKLPEGKEELLPLMFSVRARLPGD